MKDEDKTREELLAEVALLRKRVTELGVGDSESDCRRAEAALRQSEERFRLLVETAFDGINICEWDPVTRKRRLLFCNDRYVEMSGYTREQLVNAPDLDEFSGSEATCEERENSYKCFKEGTPVRGPASWLRPDGKENTYEYSARSVKVGDKYHILGFDRDITEQKRAEQALRESEERFRLLVETAFDGINICEWDPVSGSRQLIFCNDRFVEMSGHTRQALEDTDNLNQLEVSYDPKDMWEVHQERLLKGLPIGGTSSWKRPDGKENIHEWLAVCVKVGDKYHIMGSDRDITERKRAEEALRESEERFRLFAETAFDGISICEWDPASGRRRLIFGNDRFVEMSGHTRQELEDADDVNELVVSRDPEEMRAVLRERLLKGLPVAGTASWKRPDGKENIHEWSAVCVKVGDKYHIMGSDRDITERKQAEEALRESEERLRTVFEAAKNVSFVTTDLHGTKARILDFSPGAEAMFGYKGEEVIGKPLAILHVPEDARHFPKVTETLGQRGTGLTAELQLVRKSGERFPAIVTTLPILDADGNIVKVLGVSIDITERKQNEERLLEYQRRLRWLALRLSTVEEGERRRIASDLHDDVAQALGMAKMKLTELPSSLDSHDVAEQVGEVVQLVDQALQAIGSLTFELSPPILYELGLVPALEQLAEQMHEQHGIAIDVEGDGRSKILDEDLRVLLFRAVRELLINVVKHAKAENVKVSVREHRDDTEINVEDDGVGFEQAEPESRAVGSGGFGLFSIKERLEHLGGQVQIRSKSGQGTCVTLTVPLRRGRRRRAKTT